MIVLWNMPVAYITAWEQDLGSCLRPVYWKQLEKLDVLNELYLLANTLEKKIWIMYMAGALELRLVNCVLLSAKTWDLLKLLYPQEFPYSLWHWPDKVGNVTGFLCCEAEVQGVFSFLVLFENVSNAEMGYVSSLFSISLLLWITISCD